MGVFIVRSVVASCKDTHNSNNWIRNTITSIDRSVVITMAILQLSTKQFNVEIGRSGNEGNRHSGTNMSVLIAKASGHMCSVITFVGLAIDVPEKPLTIYRALINSDPREPHFEWCRSTWVLCGLSHRLFTWTFGSLVGYSFFIYSINLGIIDGLNLRIAAIVDKATIRLICTRNNLFL